MDINAIKTVSKIISSQARKSMDFVQGLDLGTPSLLFSSKDGEQRIVTIENAKRMVRAFKEEQKEERIYHDHSNRCT